MAIQTVGVVGCGQMGSGIMQVAAQRGFTVLAYDVKPEFVAGSLERIAGFLAKDVAKGKLSDDERAAALDRLRPASSLADLAACELVIEAVVEDISIKQGIFAELDAACPPATILASNTSSIPIIVLATATKRPDRFAGLHFFNPVPVMGLIELIRALTTADATVAVLKEFGAALGKVVVEAKDNAGFIVNRLLVPYLLDAIRVYEAGSASRDDIDNAMKLGCNHPMGPLALCDFIGLDTIQSIARMLYEEYHEQRLASPPLLNRLVEAGRVGKKAGHGFYEYRS